MDSRPSVDDRHAAPRQHAGSTVRWLFLGAWVVGCGLMAVFTDAPRWASPAKAIWLLMAAFGLLMVRGAWAADRRMRQAAGLHVSHRMLVTADGPRVGVSLRVPRALALRNTAVLLHLVQVSIDRTTSGAPETVLSRQSQRVALPAVGEIDGTAPNGAVRRRRPWRFDGRLDGDGDDLRVRGTFVLAPDALPSGAVHHGETRAWRLLVDGLDDGVVWDFDLDLHFAAPSPPAGLGAVPLEARRPAGLRGAGPRHVELDPAALAVTPFIVIPELTVMEQGERWSAQLPRTLTRLGAGAAGLLTIGLVAQARALFQDDDGLQIVLSLVCWLLAFAGIGLTLHLLTSRRRLVVDATGLLLDRSSALRRNVVDLGHPRRWLHEQPQVSASAAHELQAEPSGGGQPVTLAGQLPGEAAVEGIAGHLLRALAERRGRFAPRDEAPDPHDPQRRRGLVVLAWGLLGGLALVAMAHGPMQTLADLQPRQVMATWQERLHRLTPEGRAAAGLRQALESGDVTGLRAALDAGVPVDVRQDDGRTPLMQAARDGHQALVELLLGRGADLHAANESHPTQRGDTALLLALYGGHEAVALRLIEAGARLDVRNMWDWGPAHMAAQSDCTACLALLAARGVPLHAEAPASRGETPLMLAAGRGRQLALQWLLAHGGDLRRRDPQGQDALAWAEFFGRSGTSRWIREQLKASADEERLAPEPTVLREVEAAAR